MDFTLPQWVGFVGAWFGLIAGIWALFERAETVINEKTRLSIAKWLKGLREPSAPRWTKDIYEVFQLIFGERHWSWRCFRMSVLASTLFLGLLMVLYISLGNWRVHDIGDLEYQVPILFLIAAVLNLVPDFISLLKTRIILRRMRSATWLGVGMLLVGDAVLSLAIFAIPVIGFYVGTARFLATQGELLNGWGMAFDHLRDALLLRDVGVTSLGPYLYTTFLTSIWVWLYALSGVAVRALLAYGSGVRRLKGVLDIEQKPLRSIGFVAMLIVTMGFAIVPLERAIF